MTKFPTLFSPLKLGPLTLKNRILSAPMYTHGTSAEGYLEPDRIAFYERLAKGGVAVVCLGETLVHSATGNNHGRVFRLDDPGSLPSLIKCTDAIHRYNALASIELLHPGRRADPLYNAEGKVYGPSAGSCHYGDGSHEVTELTEELIDVIVNAFGDAAEMAQIGGCDFVTVHGGHGWLLGQFLAPNNNWRTDRFGGSIENRARIFVMVAENIRKKCGPDFPIDFRISGDDFTEGGATLEDAIQLAKILEDKIDMLHVSATSFHNRRASMRMFPSMFYPRGVNAYLAEEIKKHVNIPVVTVGAFNDPTHMEQLLSEKKVDAIAMGRALLADPLLPEKARTGREDDIMYCTRCNTCISVGFVPYVKYNLGVSHCAVNPWHGLEEKQFYGKVPRGNQKVLVAGGGPAGMEAALGAAEGGHRVILCEKEDSLGGALRYAWHPEFKKDIKRFVEVLGRRIERSERIDVRLNTAVTPELVREIAPDALIVAIGAKPIELNIPGVDDPRVIRSIDIHREDFQIGDKVVIIGGGMVGCEEGIDLAKSHGKEVTILEMQERLAGDAPYVHYIAILNEIEQLDNLKVELNHTCTAISNKGVICKDREDREKVFPADTIIMAVGMRGLRDEAESFRGLAPTVIPVGDCVKPSQMAPAILSGYFAGYNLQRF